MEKALKEIIANLDSSLYNIAKWLAKDALADNDRLVSFDVKTFSSTQMKVNGSFHCRAAY